MKATWVLEYYGLTYEADEPRAWRRCLVSDGDWHMEPRTFPRLIAFIFSKHVYHSFFGSYRIRNRQTGEIITLIQLHALVRL